MARVVGFEGGQSGITPATYGPAYPVSEVGVWGDSDTGLGVFGSSNALERAGVVGHSNRGNGVIGFSASALGVMGLADAFPAVYGSTIAVCNDIGPPLISASEASVPGGPEASCAMLKGKCRRVVQLH